MTTKQNVPIRVASSIYDDANLLMSNSTATVWISLWIQELPREVSSKQVLHADIMFVYKVAFFITCSSPLGLSMVYELGTIKGCRSILPFGRHLPTNIAVLS